MHTVRTNEKQRFALGEDRAAQTCSSVPRLSCVGMFLSRLALHRSGFTPAKSKGLRGLRIGGLSIGACDV
eukprot:5152389-Alexandrium_andersonii.AAC.1